MKTTKKTNTAAHIVRFQIKGPPLIEGENQNEKAIYIDSVDRSCGSLPDGCSNCSQKGKGTEPAASFDRDSEHHDKNQDSQEAQQEGAEEYGQHG
jgi:hypothetical protein